METEPYLNMNAVKNAPYRTTSIQRTFYFASCVHEFCVIFYTYIMIIYYKLFSVIF
jgi:hypothetical protein